MTLKLELVKRTIERGIEEGSKRGFHVAVGVVDATGRTLGVLRAEQALWVTPDLAVRKATYASGFQRDTLETFNRYQDEVPTFGVAIAALSGPNDWFIGPGGVGIWEEREGGKVLLGAVGVSGAFPYQQDHEISAVAAEWCMGELNRRAIAAA